MEQRLNIEIKNNKKALANCYYHWSGYTESALGLTKQIIDHINSNGIASDVKTAIKLLELTGASFSRKAWDNAKDAGIIEGDFKECNGRNEGLIGVSEEDMNETRSWEEGRMTINIDQKSFNFKCAWDKDYIDDEKVWERIRDLFFYINIESTYDIPFFKIDELIKGVNTAEKEYGGRFYFKYSAFSSIY